MPPEPARRGDTAVASRADVARLTLRLRAAQREAAEAEAAAAAAADPAVVTMLEGRLFPLLEQRRTAFMSELERVRAEALDAIADARRMAEDFVTTHAPRPPGPVTPPMGIPITVSRDASAAVGQTVDSVWAPRSADPAAWPGDSLGAAVGQEAVTPTPAPMAPAPTVLVDAEAFARAFAALIAKAIDDRTANGQHPPQYVPQYAHQFIPVPTMSPHQQQPMQQQPMQQQQPVQPVPQMIVMPPAKQGFWSHARHLDVMLLSVTMVIALVILAAWLA